MSSPLDLPDPTGLEDYRQSRVRARFAWRVLMFVLIVALYVNLFGGILGGTYLNLGRLSTASLTLFLGGLPVVGMIVTTRVVNRPETDALNAVRKRLDVTERKGMAWLYLSLLIVLGGGGGYLAAGQAGNALFAGMFIVLGVTTPFARRRLTPDMPVWALLAMSAWMTMTALWVVALVPYLGESRALNFGVVWVLAAPFGLPAYLLRVPITKAALRDDWIGQIGRAWATFLPPAQTAKIQRESGNADRALESITKRLEQPLNRAVRAETLLELAEAMVDLDDPRAVEIFAAVSRIAPTDARPFFGLARCLQSTDPERALAYVAFAEENAVRTLTGSVADDIRALREALEAA